MNRSPRRPGHRPPAAAASSTGPVALRVVRGCANWLSQSSFRLSLFSGLLFWAALPPLQWWPLGWVAPLGWLLLIRRPRLPGRHPYWAIWAASTLYWAAVMQGIRLAHWANYFGLLALSCYLGIYWPLFVAVARRAVHAWRVPLVLAAPVAWTGVELLRGYGPLGFSMGLLAHTQTARVTLIQAADLAGGYGVSFVIMLVAASLVTIVGDRSPGWRRWWPLLPAAGALGAVLLYGQLRLAQPAEDRSQPALQVALIQGSIDTVFDEDPEEPRRMLEQYSRLTDEACRKYDTLDLVVWPESMFPVYDVLVQQTRQPVQLDAFVSEEMVRSNQMAFEQLVRNGTRRLNPDVGPVREQTPGGARRGTSWLFGATTWQFAAEPPRRYNSAILVDPRGAVVERYYKMHPVMFGEYVPFGETFPGLYALFPMPNGLTPGDRIVAFHCGGLTMCPSICFESTVPHLIRKQVASLARAGQSPDVLVNLTNDGWFWGSSILDLHLQCAVFRAVELRRPMLVAANSGLSAWIDGNGRLQARGPRRAEATLLAEVRSDPRASLYERWGDLPAGLCLLCCLLVGLSFLVVRWKSRKSSNLAQV